MHKVWLITLLACLTGVSAVSLAVADGARIVEGSRLVSREFPCMSVSLPDSFKFIGSHPFEIKPVAAGTRYIFAEMDGKQISRLVIFQFEGILPGSSEIYRYRVFGPEFAGIQWRESQFAFSNAEEVRENPRHETALTVAFLESKGYQLDDALMAERLATVPDPKKRHEAIIFYMENLASTGQPLSAFFHGDDETDAWHAVAAALQIGRASCRETV